MNIGHAIREHGHLLDSAEHLLQQHHYTVNLYRECASTCANPRHADRAARLAAELETEAAVLERYRSRLAASLDSIRRRHPET